MSYWNVLTVLYGMHKMSERYVVVVNSNLTHMRAFGIYRSFKKASDDAKAWEGFVIPIESPDADNPWDASYYEKPPLSKDF